MRYLKNRYRLISLIIVLIAIPVTVLLVQQTIRLFTGAEQFQAKIFIQPASTDLTGPTAFKVMVDPMTNEVAFVSVTVNFDNTKVRLVNSPQMSTALQNVVSVTDISDANANGSILLAVSQATSQPTAPSQLFELAQLIFEPAEGQGNNISASLTLTDAEVVEKTNATVLNAELVGASLIIKPSLANQSSNTVDMTFASSSTSVLVNSEFEVNLTMDTNGFDIVGTDLVLTYDPTKLAIDSATLSTFDNKINETIDNATGRYTASLFNDTSSPTVNSASASILTINLRALSQGSATLNVSTDSVIAGTGEMGQSLSIAGTPLSLNISAPTASPTPSPSPTPTVTPTATPVVYRDADINQDGFVNIQDYVKLWENYSLTNPSVARADINKDGRVNIRDYALLYEAFE